MGLVFKKYIDDEDLRDLEDYKNRLLDFYLYDESLSVGSRKPIRDSKRKAILAEIKNIEKGIKEHKQKRIYEINNDLNYFFY